jgi:hypothetical protein
MKKIFLLAVVITALTTLHKLNVQEGEAVRQMACANAFSMALYNLSKGELLETDCSVC